MAASRSVIRRDRRWSSRPSLLASARWAAICPSSWASSVERSFCWPTRAVFCSVVSATTFDLGATGVGLALQRGQPVDVGAQRLHRLGAGLGHVIQVAQIAAQQLRIVAGQQRRPGRQAAGVLGAQLVGQLDAAGQRRLLGADLFQAAQVGLGLAIGLGQLAQPQIDAGNGRFGLFQRVGRFLAGGLARVDVLLQVLDAVAQLGLLALGLGLAPGQVIGAARAESVPPARTTANNNPDARRMTEPVST